MKKITMHKVNPLVTCMTQRLPDFGGGRVRHDRGKKNAGRHAEQVSERVQVVDVERDLAGQAPGHVHGGPAEVPGGVAAGYPLAGHQRPDLGGYFLVW